MSPDYDFQSKGREAKLVWSPQWSKECEVQEWSRQSLIRTHKLFASHKRPPKSYGLTSQNERFSKGHPKRCLQKHSQKVQQNRFSLPSPQLGDSRLATSKCSKKSEQVRMSQETWFESLEIHSNRFYPHSLESAYDFLRSIELSCQLAKSDIFSEPWNLPKIVHL